jgi:hypothetical protein
MPRCGSWCTSSWVATRWCSGTGRRRRAHEARSSSPSSLSASSRGAWIAPASAQDAPGRLPGARAPLRRRHPAPSRHHAKRTRRSITSSGGSRWPMATPAANRDAGGPTPADDDPGVFSTSAPPRSR